MGHLGDDAWADRLAQLVSTSRMSQARHSLIQFTAWVAVPSAPSQQTRKHSNGKMHRTSSGAQFRSRTSGLPLHAVPAMAATAAATATAAVTARPTHRAAGAATAAVAGPAGAAVQGRAGRAPVRPFRTRLLRWRRSRRSARLLRVKRRRSQIFGTASSVTLGMTGREPPRNCTICSRRLVSRFGSARRTLAWECR